MRGISRPAKDKTARSSNTTACPRRGHWRLESGSQTESRWQATQPSQIVLVNAVPSAVVRWEWSHPSGFERSGCQTAPAPAPTPRARDARNDWSCRVTCDPGCAAGGKLRRRSSSRGWRRCDEGRGMGCNGRGGPPTFSPTGNPALSRTQCNVSSKMRDDRVSWRQARFSKTIVG